MSVPLRRRWARMKKRSGISLLPVAVVAAVLCAVLWQGIDRCLYPVIETMAVSSAVNRVSEAVSVAVADCVAERQLTYQDFVTLEKDSDGRISSLTGNLSSISLLKRDLVAYLTDVLDVLRDEEFGIPLGTLTGWMIFSGKGPTVRVELLSVGDVTADMRHSFTEAGINQTLHQVYLDVSAAVYLMIPGEILSAEIDTSVCVAETIIVGQVPETYLYVGNGEK